MRLVIFGTIGLVVGLGGGVGYSVMSDGGAVSSEVEAAVSDSSVASAADSTGAIAVADSAPQSESGADSLSRSIASSLIRIPTRDSTPSDSTTSESSTPEDGASPEGTEDDPETAGAEDDGLVSTDPAAPADSIGAPPGAETGLGDPAGALADSTSSSSGDASDPTQSGVGSQIATAASQLSPEDDAGYRRVSRILAAMDADEAAQVLSGLQDAEVRQLITLLPPRTAASILAELDPARVARLSRGLFKPAGS